MHTSILIAPLTIVPERARPLLSMLQAISLLSKPFLALFCFREFERRSPAHGPYNDARDFVEAGISAKARSTTGQVRKYLDAVQATSPPHVAFESFATTSN